MTSEPDQQALDLPGLARQAARLAPKPTQKPPVRAAETDPVVSVLVDVPLAHLDRPFDYLVPHTLDSLAVPGARVKVRFAGQDVDGYVVARKATSDHGGKLQPLRRVVSAEPVLTLEIAALTDEISKRWAGTRSDVLRLAIPPRHATTERADSPSPPIGTISAPSRAGWRHYDEGEAFLDAIPGGARAVWSARPGEDWAARLSEAVANALIAGLGSVVCVPDRRDLERLDAAMTRVLGAGHHVVLHAESGPAQRYAAFLSLSRGAVKVAIGTRAAAFAPVHDLGLVAIWDDGDDLYAEPRAPYCHTREVLLLRARATQCAAIVGGFSRSVEAHYLLRTGWAKSVEANREQLRTLVRVRVTGADEGALDRDPQARFARLPSQAHQLIAEASARGPVLVHTPRAGYALRLACDRCRTRAECAHCHGPLRVPRATAPPECAWCGTVVSAWRCEECGGRGLRAPVVGERRTAEEFGRSFPGVAVRTSSAGHIIDRVGSSPGIVVATPGAEPPATGGYAAVVLLDTWLSLGRDDVRSEEEALRRWCNAAALVAPGAEVLAVGDASEPTIQALVRWDPAGFAERLIAERQSAHLPPASRMATISGAVEDLAAVQLDLPPGGEALGPVLIDEAQSRLVLRVPRAQGAQLSSALRDLQANRSARKLPHLRVQVDPLVLT